MYIVLLFSLVNVKSKVDITSFKISDVVAGSKQEQKLFRGRGWGFS